MLNMTRLQWLLGKLAEEGSEVAKNALKTMQFGPIAHAPEKTYNNFLLCHEELDDLVAVIEMLNEEFRFGYRVSRERVDDKKEKAGVLLSGFKRRRYD
jgi:hypothetical protein